MNRSIRILFLILAFCVALSGMTLAVDGTVNASGLKIRAEASTDADVLGRVYQGEVLDVVGIEGDWYVVNYEGQTAYVFAEYVDADEEAVRAAMDTSVDGTVNASTLRVRAETSTDSEVIGKVYSGDTLDIVGKIGEWYVINYNGQAAYVFAEYIDMGDVQVQGSMGTITGSTVNVRTAPGTGNPIAGRLMDGTMVNVLGVSDGWYQIKFAELVGYVHPDYLSVDGMVFTQMTVQDDGTTELTFSTGSTSNEEPAENVNIIVPDTTIGGQVVAYAYNYLGYAYVYGGESPEEGFDCSGFTQYVYKQMGYDINRTSSDQYDNGTFVPKDELQLGDLVFFSRGSKSIGHVGIYVGEGYFIHATSPGDVVRVTSLSSEYYTARYVGARRIA